MKYKLIKELPFENSPKIGYISSPNPLVKDKAHYWNGNWFNPKNYPEFWQEVVEKDYEILSLIASERHPQHKKGSKFLHNKDYGFKNMYPTEFWDIYSVKRISDNKIFTIGDSYEDLIIEKMFMSVDNNIITTYKPKAKQPLFTTEDGVDIFDGNKYFICTASLGNCINNEGIVGKFFKTNPNYKYFSTKEKAEEYILMNKPVLSLKEIKETTTIKGLSLKKLEKLVQQKLNK